MQTNRTKLKEGDMAVDGPPPILFKSLKPEVRGAAIAETETEVDVEEKVELEEEVPLPLLQVAPGNCFSCDQKLSLLPPLIDDVDVDAASKDVSVGGGAVPFPISSSKLSPLSSECVE